MRKFILGLILLILAAQAAIHIDPTSTARIDFTADVDGGFYEGYEGNIEIKLIKDNPSDTGTLYVTAKPLRSSDGFKFSDSALEWSIHEIKGDSNMIDPARPLKSWTPYRNYEIPICKINDEGTQAVISLRTTLRRVPSCQPERTYETQLEFDIR